MKRILLHKRQGYTLIETLVATAVFVVIALSIYQTFTKVFQAVSDNKARIAASTLANEQLEIIRNLPYSEVGIQGGLPAGVLTHVQIINRNGIIFSITTTVREIDDPFDGTFPTDTTPADYKMVQLDLVCTSCINFAPLEFTTNVGPKSLETPSTSGALFVQVFDANGQPVQDANVHIFNASSTPTITIDDTTNNSGLLQIVDAPPGINAYQVSVSKSGYSQAQTYTPNAPSNPNPSQPHATVIQQQTTQLSFGIDKVSTLNVSTINTMCSSTPSVGFSLTGSKLVGTNPDILKYNQTFTTDGSGLKTINNLEWDNYSSALNDSTYDLAGTIPLVPFNLSPNATQNLQFIVQPKNPKEVLVTVRDASTQLPLTNATVVMTKSGVSSTEVTGQGFLNQTNWTGGSGQTAFVDPTKYFSSDGNVDTSSLTNGIKLKSIAGVYSSSGILTSSTFDMGSPSNFYQISWLPQDQPVQTGTDSVKFQIASNNDGATWNYSGPDGTANTYYTVTNTNINTINNGNRYIRYKLFMQTANTSYSPSVSNVAITFTSSCVPPGQVIFSGLAGGTYTMTVSKTGYQPYSNTVDVSTNWQEQDITLSQ